MHWGGLSWADGIASTVEGQGSEVKTSTQFQGATARIYGAMNEIDATADKKPYDGVANSIVGAVNATKDANAALIFGAGNVITNSYGELVDKDGKAVDPAELQTKLQAAYAKDGYAGIAKVLGNYVTKSGGSVLAIGGGNTADWAKASAMIGIGNTITGKSGAESKGNFLAGQSNTVKDSNDARVIGSENTVENSKSQVVIGDKNSVTGRNVGTNSGKQEERTQNVLDLTIGKGNTISNNDTYMQGYESLTIIGNNNEATSPTSGIVIGDYQTFNTLKDSVIIGSMTPKEKESREREQGGASVVVGYHAQSGGGLNVAVGYNALARGQEGTVVGHNSVIETNDTFTPNIWSSIYGVNNEITSDGKVSNGVSGSIIGTWNKLENSDNSMAFGAGNMISHAMGDTTNGLEGTFGQGMLTELLFRGGYEEGYSDDAAKNIGTYAATGGGSVLAMGNGNISDYARRSQVIGTGNTLSGTESDVSANNTVAGFQNVGTKVNRVSVVGTGNKVSEETADVVIGDYHELTGGTNNIILGSMATKESVEARTYTPRLGDSSSTPGGVTGTPVPYYVKTIVPDKTHTANISNAVMLGYNTDVTKNGGVALGSDSVASVDKGVYGYDPISGKSIQNDATAAALAGKKRTAGSIECRFADENIYVYGG